MTDTPPTDERQGNRLSRRTFLQASAGVAALASPAGAAATHRRGRGSRAGGRVTVGVFQNPGNLDPGGEGIIVDAYITDNVTEPLIYHFSGSDKYYPGLATKWTISPNATTYTFHLRRGVSFHDGTRFDAKSVKATFDHIVDPKTKARAPIGELGPYKGTKILDDYTVQVVFKAPNAAFLNELTESAGGISSAAALAKDGPVGYGNHPVGTGPFMFKDWVRGQTVTLARNPKYNWAPAFYKHRGPALLDEVVFRILPDPGARANALRTGEITLAEDLNPQDVGPLVQSKQFQKLAVDSVGMGYCIAINAQKSPTDDLRVRQAIQYATDQKSLVQTLFFGLYDPAHQVFTPPTPGYDPSLEHLYTFDPKKAGHLLDAAGWKMGGGGIREKNGKKLTLAFINIAGFGFDGISQVLQAQWKKVGIGTDISDQSFPAVAATLNRGDQNLGDLFYYDVDPDGVLRATFACNQIAKGYNWFHYCNAKLDGLAAKADATQSLAKRTALYKQANRMIMKDAAMLPVYDLRKIWTGSSKLSGVTFTPSGYPYFYGARLA